MHLPPSASGTHSTCQTVWTLKEGQDPVVPATQPPPLSSPPTFPSARAARLAECPSRPCDPVAAQSTSNALQAPTWTHRRSSCCPSALASVPTHKRVKEPWPSFPHAPTEAAHRVRLYSPCTAKWHLGELFRMRVVIYSLIRVWALQVVHLSKLIPLNSVLDICTCHDVNFTSNNK